MPTRTLLATSPASANGSSAGDNFEVRAFYALQGEHDESALVSDCLSDGCPLCRSNAGQRGYPERNNSSDGGKHSHAAAPRSRLHDFSQASRGGQCCSCWQSGKLQGGTFRSRAEAGLLEADYVPTERKQCLDHNQVRAGNCASSRQRWQSGNQSPDRFLRGIPAATKRCSEFLGSAEFSDWRDAPDFGARIRQQSSRSSEARSGRHATGETEESVFPRLGGPGNTHCLRSIR